MLEVYNEAVYDLLGLPPARGAGARCACLRGRRLLTAVRPERPRLDLRLNGTQGVYVEGLVREPVASVEAVTTCMVRALRSGVRVVIFHRFDPPVQARGSRSRSVGCNNVNEHSSRSHLVVCVEV